MAACFAAGAGGVRQASTAHWQQQQQQQQQRTLPTATETTTTQQQQQQCGVLLDVTALNAAVAELPRML
jgi:hypothetical protein